MGKRKGKVVFQHQNTSTGVGEKHNVPESDAQKSPECDHGARVLVDDNNVTRAQQIQYKKLPIVIWMLEKTGLLSCKPLISHKALVFTLTFLCYISYVLSRKPFSVVKVVFCPECANCNISNKTEHGWEPFNNSTNAKSLLGVIDYSWLFAYAVASFISGQIADRMNLRYFLAVGMLGNAVAVSLWGVAYFTQIHQLWYFILIQIMGGALQSTGWPGVVAVMSHWFGKQNRGLIMGIWNCNTSIGGILGSIIPAIWADCDGEEGAWGWAFLVPSLIAFCLGILIFLMLVVNPKHVGLPPPNHSIDGPEETTPLESQSDETLNQPQPKDGATDEDDKSVARVSEIAELPEKTETNSDEASSVRQEAHPRPKFKSINILRAFLIPGVIEFSLAFFFNKLVSYTFLYWLPFYVKNTLSYLSGPEAGWLSTLFDFGGLLGGILAGIISDQLRARAIVCVTMLLLAIPSLFVLEAYADASFGWFVTMLIICGIFVNGPYAMISTAVASDLGTHKSLKNNQNAKATVTAIINGTGSFGAALGPLVVGLITSRWDWMAAFYVLMCSCFLSALLLSRLVFRDLKRIYLRCKNRQSCICVQLTCGRRRPTLDRTPDNELTTFSKIELENSTD